MSPAFKHLLRLVGGIVRLARPLNFLLFLSGVLLGAYLASGPSAFSGDTLPRVLVAMISASLIGAAANAINDYFDQEIDKINRPDRPLVSGLLSERTAVFMWAAGASFGCGLGWFLGPVHLAVAVTAVVLTFLYSKSLQKYGLPGNVVVGLVVAVAVLYGALATGRLGYSWIGALFAFLTLFPREIVKDIEDMEGDLAVGVRTLPARIGLFWSAVAAAIPIGFAILVSPIPFLRFAFGGWYLVWIGVADLTLLYALWCLFASSRRHELVSRSSALIKTGVAFGIVALMLARF